MHFYTLGISDSLAYPKLKNDMLPLMIQAKESAFHNAFIICGCLECTVKSTIVFLAALLGHTLMQFLSEAGSVLSVLSAVHLDSQSVP